MANSELTAAKADRSSNVQQKLAISIVCIVQSYAEIYSRDKINAICNRLYNDISTKEVKKISPNSQNNSVGVFFELENGGYHSLFIFFYKTYAKTIFDDKLELDRTDFHKLILHG